MHFDGRNHWIREVQLIRKTTSVALLHSEERCGIFPPQCFNKFHKLRKNIVINHASFTENVQVK